MSLQGKRALVTGGSRGLGAAICKVLAERGARVAVNYSASPDRAEETRASLAGQGHVIIQGDVFTHEGVDALVAGTIKALGGIDFIVSNAGWTKFGPYSDIKAIADEDWDRCWHRNVMAHLWLAQAAEEELKKNHGSLVISASAAGLRPSGSSMAYSVSKAASSHLTKCLAKSLAPNVTVNAVAPGLMMTEWSAGFSDAQVQHAKNNTLLKQTTGVEDAAGAFAAVLENRSMTGQTIEVSCGMGMA
ncbi:uncharacterized protein EHS24_003377 [Apiotrichum porosum]|uniref:Granaticin polyketide synthase ketoacyl reductase 2 n=1 Tax=Apiotrichum porosum TaxID=105984 RepID=A0A427XES8_9TREE|nr:uncharacterized protein EHS24_003377 [Apiotrichum porosum]RSH77411.1 hypothetical protein EHS24_003377 [Apiotrichum porosum]